MSDFKGFCCQRCLDLAGEAITNQLQAADELAKAAKRQAKWMQTVMDGFSIKKNDGARAKVLDPLNEALAAYEKVRGNPA